MASATRGEWFQHQRLRFIEDRLFWSGRLTSRDLTERFNIHRSVASRDLGMYRVIAPRNMLYDRRQRCFVTGRYFLPVFGQPSVGQLVAHDILGDKFPAANSAFHWLPTIRRHIDPAVARNVAECIRSLKDLLITYRSLKIPNGQDRWISPTALVSDGHRWHVRAFCNLRNDYRDFVLGRMVSADKTQQREVELPADEDWEEIISVRLIPHPSLTVPQRNLVRTDYKMEADGLKIPCRKALLLYALIGMGLEEEREPPRQVLALADPSIRSLIEIL